MGYNLNFQVDAAELSRKKRKHVSTQNKTTTAPLAKPPVSPAKTTAKTSALLPESLVQESRLGAHNDCNLLQKILLQPGTMQSDVPEHLRLFVDNDTAEHEVEVAAVTHGDSGNFSKSSLLHMWRGDVACTRFLIHSISHSGKPLIRMR